MIIKDLPDEELVALLQQEGNSRFFPILAGRYEREILSRCKSYVKDKVVAEDLAQEVLIKVYIRIPAFRKEARFSTWLYAIIHNTCIDHLRKSRKKSAIIIEQLTEVANDIAEFEESPGNEITISLLEELLDQLTPEEKLILLLKYRDKHSILDIHNSLGISESAVKMRLARARKKISSLLDSRKK